ncbi:unnamed protein product, partial [Vitis vinifera]|uniref:Uncharacterized protein n=1 Tax=Vitis vinifera TaxID=29760 RepID=D7T641_VITVI
MIERDIRNTIIFTSIYPANNFNAPNYDFSFSIETPSHISYTLIGQCFLPSKPFDLMSIVCVIVSTST